jgi:ribosome-binding ATPase YchF (GTP1/OBG family)
MEEDLNGIDDEERVEFLNEFGISSSGLDQIIRTGYYTLGLQSYFTQGPKESRAWTIRKGDRAPQAAGVIHTDFQRGFIRAQVMGYDDFLAYDGEQGCRDQGVLRTEGREYVVADGDIIEFLFNV